MKKTGSMRTAILVIALIAVMLSAVACSPKDDGSGEFEPVLRFAVTSDVHIRSTSNDYQSLDHLTRMIDGAYKYSDAQEYSKLDGIFFVGDNTQNGKKAEQTIFFDTLKSKVREGTVARAVMGNHEFYSVGSGSDRYLPDSIAQSTANFLSYSGYESQNVHLVINGYHFILVSADSYDKANQIYLTKSTLDWMKTELDKAAADDPSGERPIFVFQHEPPDNNEVRGFTGGDARLTELLNNYPQVVDFSGHTHRPINDPCSLWQDGFTGVGTGGLAYLGLTIAGHPKNDNDAVVELNEYGDYVDISTDAFVRNAGMFYIVEVSADDRVRLIQYDIFTDSVYGEPVTFGVGDPDKFEFTPERAEASVAPEFDSSASVEIISTDYAYPEISFPQAKGVDPAQNYRIEAWDADDTSPTLTVYRLSGLHYGDGMPDRITAALEGLGENTSYTLRIYPVNYWAKAGEPLIGNITIGESSLSADVLSLEFNTDGSATDSASGAVLDRIGTGSVSYDEELGMNVASFDGFSGFKFSGVADYYRRFVTSFSTTAMLRVDELPEKSCAVGSNTDSAGFGLTITPAGELKFYCRGLSAGNNKYIVASTGAVVTPGEWIHVACVFDGKLMRMYINGELATLYEDGVTVGTSVAFGERVFVEPSGLGRAFMVGGDITSYGLLESGFIGDIAIMEIYSRNLSADEIAQIYSSIS